LQFHIIKKASGYFAISSNNLITVWSGSIDPGYYPVRVRAVGINEQLSGSATFIINVIDAPSLPTPTGITFLTITTSLPDNSPAGTTVATFSVSMSDGSSFAGTLGTSPAGTVAISGSMQLVLARAHLVGRRFTTMGSYRDAKRGDGFVLDRGSSHPSEPASVAVATAATPATPGTYANGRHFHPECCIPAG
jgi:hypothetical protein